MSRFLVFNNDFITVDRRDRQYMTLGIILAGKAAFYLLLLRIIDKQTGAFRKFIFRKQKINGNSSFRPDA